MACLTLLVGPDTQGDEMVGVWVPVEPRDAEMREAATGWRAGGLVLAPRPRFLQEWHALGDPRRKGAPNESTLLQFLNVLELHGRAKWILAGANRRLVRHEVKLLRGAIAGMQKSSQPRRRPRTRGKRATLRCATPESVTSRFTVFTTSAAGGGRCHHTNAVFTSTLMRAFVRKYYCTVTERACTPARVTSALGSGCRLSLGETFVDANRGVLCKPAEPIKCPKRGRRARGAPARDSATAVGYREVSCLGSVENRTQVTTCARC